MLPPADLRTYLEDLERFSDGQMTLPEQEAFEERLEHDEGLQHAYEVYQQLTADLRWVAGHETLRLRLQSLDKRLDERQAALNRMRDDTRRKRTFWGTAALITSLVVSALVLGYLLWRSTPATATLPTDAWTRYYAPDPGFTEMSPLATRRPVLAEAMHQYHDQQYAAALRTLRRVAPDRIGQDTLLYYNGVFLLRAGQADAARPYLQRVSEQPGSRLAGKALYNLGMAAWKTKQPTEAQRILLQVAADSLNPYQQAARHVLAANVLE